MKANSMFNRLKNQSGNNKENMSDHKIYSKKEVLEILKKRGTVTSYGTLQPGVSKLLQNLDTKNLLILDLGSFNRRLTENVLNVDLVDDIDTDIVEDICKLVPFEDNMFDVVICTAVLEHVAEPTKIVSDIYRILKPGGIVWSDIPFLQPLHRVPTDFQRYTIDGIKYLFRNFDEIESGSANTIGASMIWILDEFRKIVLKYSIDNYLTNLLDKDWEKFKQSMLNIDSTTQVNIAEECLIVTGAVFFCGKKPLQNIS